MIVPDYTVAVTRMPVYVDGSPNFPSKYGYACMLCVPETSRLLYGHLIGFGDNVDEAVADWNHQITQFLMLNPTFNQWPDPCIAKASSIQTFTWHPYDLIAVEANRK